MHMRTLHIVKLLMIFTILLVFCTCNFPNTTSDRVKAENEKYCNSLNRFDKSMTDQFQILLEMAEAQHFIHYEISNFAREGFYSKHNSLYWTGGHYIGLGPSAHSYNGYSRRWNKSSMKAWLGLNDYYDESFEQEILSLDQRYNEYVMTSLRTIWGCDINVVRQEFGEEYAVKLLAASDKFITDESVVFKGSRLFLTNKGKLFADGIASALFS